MGLNLIDQLTLLALDDEKGTLVADSTAFSYALGGAVIMELALQELQQKESDAITASTNAHACSTSPAISAAGY